MLEHDYLPGIGEKLNELGIKTGVVGGGSYSYRQNQFDSLQEIRDLDVLIIIDTKEHLIQLLTRHNDELNTILKLEKIEKIFSEDELWPLGEGVVAGIRYAGINIFGQKISVKFIVGDVLKKAVQDKNPHPLNIISKKDRRFYPRKTFSGQSIYLGIINQKISGELVILGDPDIFITSNNFSLGVVSDVFLSGTIIYDNLDLNLLSLQENLISKIGYLSSTLKSPIKDWSEIFIRSDRFPDDFKKQINQRFSEIIPESQNQKAPNPEPAPQFEIHLVPHIMAKHHMQIDLKNKEGYGVRELNYVRSGPFSSNSEYGVAICHNGEKVFFKEMLDDLRFRGEIFGAITASAYFANLQEPLFVNPEKNLIAYPWHNSDIVARKRLLPIDEDIKSFIMELELRRAEDHLNAFVLSATDISRGTVKKDDIYLSRIHELFYGRLLGERLEKYYGEHKVVVNNDEIPFTELLGMTFVINGKKYAPLVELVKVAIEKLNPDRLNNGLLVCGIGDSHSGNVMCEGDPYKYQYVDYEFAGFHSPYLDIAKSLYNDSAFNVFYVDKKAKQINLNIEIKKDGDELIINHNYVPDELSRFILKTKIDGIINPMHIALSKNGINEESDWREVLGAALLCCGLLTRNIADFDNDGFWLNLINVMEMQDFEVYYEKMTQI